MPWAGGSFSRTDGTRTGTTVWAQAKAALVKIIAADHDTHDQDLATGINQTINKDGSNAFTGDADLGSNQLTNVGAGSAATDGATIGGTETLAGKTMTAVKWVKGADIASATTLVLGTDGNFFDITGTTTITGFTVAAGTPFMLQFDGALTLTHHATNLILPGAANITTIAGDVLSAFAHAADQITVVSFQSANLASVAATQAEQETGTSTSRVVTPGRQQYHPSTAKAWALFDGTGIPAITVSYNCSSITDVGTGHQRVDFTTAFSTANYCVVTNSGSTSALLETIQTESRTTALVNIRTWTATGAADTNKAAIDIAAIYLACFGDQ